MTTQIASTGTGFKVTVLSPPKEIQKPVGEISNLAKFTVYFLTTLSTSSVALANSDGFLQAESKFHKLSTQIIDLITTLSEPILWGFAVVGFLLMVNDKNRGWQKVKSTMYAFLGITLLPGIFSILTFIGKTIANSFQS